MEVGGGRLARGENNKSRHRNRKRLYNVHGFAENSIILSENYDDFQKTSLAE